MTRVLTYSFPCFWLSEPAVACGDDDDGADDGGKGGSSGAAGTGGKGGTAGKGGTSGTAGEGGALGGQGGETSGGAGGEGGDVQTCEVLANTAPTVGEIQRTGSVPAPRGGTITNGMYEMQPWDVYPPASASSSMRSTTLYVTGNRWEVVGTTRAEIRSGSRSSRRRTAPSSRSRTRATARAAIRTRA